MKQARVLALVACVALGASASGCATEQNSSLSDETPRSADPDVLPPNGDGGVGNDGHEKGRGENDRVTPEADKRLTDELFLRGVNMDLDQARFTFDALVISPGTTSKMGKDPTSGWKLAIDTGWEVGSLPQEGCTAEQATLIRDAFAIAVNNDCSIKDGDWADPFTGDPLTLENVTAGHVLPPEIVWASGGAEWDKNQWLLYSNSPISVLSTSVKSISERGAQGFEEWGPTSGSACAYAVRWIAVKSEFGLSITEDESVALGDALDSCEEVSAAEA